MWASTASINWILYFFFYFFVNPESVLYQLQFSVGGRAKEQIAASFENPKSGKHWANISQIERTLTFVVRAFRRKQSFLELVINVVKLKNYFFVVPKSERHCLLGKFARRLEELFGPKCFHFPVFMRTCKELVIKNLKSVQLRICWSVTHFHLFS